MATICLIGSLVAIALSSSSASRDTSPAGTISYTSFNSLEVTCSLAAACSFLRNGTATEDQEATLKDAEHRPYDRSRPHALS